MDEAVIAAMAAAVVASPDRLPLRRHLVEVLVRAGRWAEALEHCRVVLAQVPDDVQVLQYAGEAARALGDARVAASYERILRALGPLPAAPDAARRRRAGGESGQAGGAAGDRDGERDPAARPGPAACGQQPAGGAHDGRAAAPIHEPERPRLRVIDGGDGGDGSDGGGTGDDDLVERTAVTLADVAGMENVKRRLELAFLGSLRSPEMLRAYGKSLRGGLILYGPPGCGKTYVARALAGELRAGFIEVNLTDVLDMYVGESEKRLHGIFESARRAAPCVLLFAELDAFGRKRSLMRGAADRELINQLLAELDGAGAGNEGVYVLGATNHPWDVDPALRRPGRFDRMLLVQPPDGAARRAILAHRMRERPVEGVDYDSLAERTAHFSGADLVHLCETVTEFAIADALGDGRPRPVIQADFKRALKEVRPSTRPWIETARNYALFANEGGAYDDLLDYLRGAKLL